MVLTGVVDVNLAESTQCLELVVDFLGAPLHQGPHTPLRLCSYDEQQILGKG